MKPITQRVVGKLIREKTNGRAALLLRELAAEEGAVDLVYLRYALVTRGPEDHIFPSFLLDDWGNEVRGLPLYQWVYEFGDQFPRGEIFGFERDGRETQVFLRELELYARLPCYAYATRDVALADGIVLTAVLLPDTAAAAVQRIAPPEELERPLRSARVTWWRVPPDSGEFDFSLIERPPDPGI